MQGLSPVPPRQKQPNHIDANRAAFKVTEKRGFFDENDTLWEKGSMIYWDGPLNLGFEPLNELAEDRMREYLTHLDKKGQEVAEQRGSGYASQVDAFEARRRLTEMDKMNVNEEEKVNIMRGHNPNARKATSIDAENNAQVPMMRGKRGPKAQNVEGGNKFSMNDKEK